MTLQNGVGNVEIIEKFVPASHIIHGITTYPCDIIGPGHIRSQSEGYIKMMSVDGKHRSRLDAIATLFKGAGLDCEITPQAHIAIWEKLAFNSVMNALTALLRVNVGQLGDTVEGMELASQIVDEIISVAHAKEIFIDRERILSTISMAFDKHRDHKPSMYQDILKKRKTEIDFINGAAANEAKKLGIHLPVNETIYRLIKIVEAAHADKEKG
jgi:2-dehydropantoate 2-reductase